MRVFTALFLCVMLSAGVSAAQERANTILVLDGSGSMWGQIEGVNKIVIARDVVGRILADFPSDQNLGLTVYGHRERGNCADIETIVAPGPNTVPGILAAVNAINPRGKTPMTDAVIAAAQALRYTEEPATVILVSDGIETCNPDPCAAARALEQAGIDFTAHVVGFDVTEAAALAQMQCIADETGGAFLTASNADELADALVKVTAAVAPEPQILAAPVTFRAIHGADGPEVIADIVWDISGPTGVEIRGGVATPQAAFSADLVVAQNYTAIARDLANASEGATQFVVDEGAQTVTVVLPAPLPPATIAAPDSAPLGSTISVDWTGPNGARDYISIAAVDQGATSYVNFTYLSELGARGLLMPPAVGTYELRYVSSATNKVLATRAIDITPVDATLTAPASALAGAAISIDWMGPGYARDYISVAAADQSGGVYVNYTYTADGSPLSLLMPAKTGEYEVRYILAQDNTIMARAMISVQDITATLAAPETASVGETIQVDWTGPNYDRDYISVAKPGESGGQYVNYRYTNQGAPAELLMPSEPGTYEIRYIVAQDNTVLASRTITVEDVSASLTAPPFAPMGATIAVTWTGPNYPRDYISVARLDHSGGQYVNYTYTENGSPLNLVMPAQVGDYEIRYILAQDNVVLSRHPVTIEPVTATITAPPSVPLSANNVTVTWDGPGYARDYISISKLGENGYETYAYTNAGNPLAVRLPEAAGDYEIRYVMGQDEVVLGSAKLTVTAD